MIRGVNFTSLAVISAVLVLGAILGALSVTGVLGAQGFMIPFEANETSDQILFGISNEGTGGAIEGSTSSSQAATAGIYGHTENGSGRPPGLASGVWGDSERGFGVVGTSDNIAVFGLSESGIALDAFSESGTALLLNTRSGDFIIANGLDTNNNVNRRFRVSNSGDVFADGQFNANGADLADLFSTSQLLEPGDVLSIDNLGNVVKSSSAFETRVIGVYSTKPAFLGDNSIHSEDLALHNVPVALAGVVPVKVSDENGSIMPGDLLVASSTPGMAMRADANPPTGSVIGKALEISRSSNNTMKMLVMLR